MAWKPMGAAEDFHDTLYPGVPVWMDQELTIWFERNFDVAELVGLGRMWDSASRNPKPITPSLHYGYPRMRRDHTELSIIRFLDYIVHIHGEEAEDSGLGFEEERRMEQLVSLLERCGSAWKLGTRDGYWGLEDRVPEGVQEAADHVITTTGSAGALLSEAWHAAFGVNPDPEEAYEKAIKAVVEAGAQQVEPNNKNATLATTLGEMRNSGKWTVEIVDKKGDHYTDLVYDMIDALWNGQPSRHGANGYRKPTQGEAEAAVMLAVPLVQWFHSGAVERRA